MKKLHDNLYIPDNFEENHVYFADQEGSKRYTGVTTILGVLNKPALVPWAARMAVEYVYEKFEETKDITKLGEYLEQAKTAYAKKRDKGADEGTKTHALVEEYVNACITDFDGEPKHQMFEGIEPFVEWARKENIRFISAETPLVSEKLWVAGTADLIFEKDGKRYIGDIKTYKKIWDRTPMYQCAGYALMWEEMQMEKKPLPPINGEAVLTPIYDIAGYCIINLPKERAFNEKEDIRWSYDVAGDTKAFLACVELYKQNKNWK